MNLAGRVNSKLQARVQLVVLSADRRQIQIDAMVDTGFTGHLILPSETIRELDLVSIGAASGRLASGEIVSLWKYEGRIQWLGVELAVPVLESSGSALIGMGLLRGCDLSIRIRPGGAVSITRRD